MVPDLLDGAIRSGGGADSHASRPSEMSSETDLMRNHKITATANRLGLGTFTGLSSIIVSFCETDSVSWNNADRRGAVRQQASVLANRRPRSELA